jgi:aspartyl-tRNA(Asn)/glutamyl-tRNA(Gln) amidotransferase subunit B
VREIIACALRHASTLPAGVYVQCGESLLSPLNLRFVETAPARFKNLNMQTPVYNGVPLGDAETRLADEGSLASRLEAAAGSICVLKVFPGMRYGIIQTLISSGTKRFILELYGAGTANAGVSAHSIRRALIDGREKGVAFYCTSQQEGSVDFSEYASSHVLWQEGAIPMGNLTTESTYAKLLAAIALSDTDDEVSKLMGDND